MAKLQILSYEQIFGKMVRAFQAKTGITDLNTAAVSVSTLEAAAENDFLLSSDIFSALDSKDINRSEGPILDLLANDEGLTRAAASYSSGAVSMIDTSFNKLSTSLYPGRPAPIVNTSIIYVNNTTGWPSTGSVYIGRGTVNVEGPLPYTAIAAVGSYFSITLGTSTNKFHNVNEFVTLAQGGNRTVPSGTILNTGVIGASQTIPFSTTNAITISDGEVEVDGVPVICSQLGTIGNLPINAITQFASSPVPNLTVFNPLPFTNAVDQESDISLRDRIKQVRSTSDNATAPSILNAITNLVAPDEQKRIVSAQVIDGDQVNPTIIYIDDGSGYEPIFTGVGQEVIIDSAIGGEQYLQLQNQGVVKALISTISTQPFALVPGASLAVSVGGLLSQHTFAVTDFYNISAATVYEVVASINANSNLLFSARTTGGGTKVVLFSKTDANEYIQVTTAVSGFDANSIFNFQSNQVYTLKLYRNDNLLTKDGVLASITSISFPWNLPNSSYSLTIAVDGTPATTYTFGSLELAPYLPTTAPLQTWINAINAKIPGITASQFGNQVTLSSNKAQSSAASLAISGGTLVTTAGVFSVASSTGAGSDYTLIRGTGQIKLTNPAVVGDNFKAGTSNTRAYVQSGAQISGAVNISTTGGIYLIADFPATSVITGALPGVSIAMSNSNANIWRYTGPANTFTNVANGNWVIIWDTAVNASNRGYFRICNTDKSTYIEVENINGTVTGSPYTLSTAGGFLVYASSGIIQKYTANGPTNQSLQQWANDINNNLIGVQASVAQTNYIRLTTNTFNAVSSLTTSVGSITILSIEPGAAGFGFVVGSTDTNNQSHIGFSETTNSELGTPLFQPDVFCAANNAATPPVFVSTVSLTVSPDKMMSWSKTPNGATFSYYGNNRWNWDGISHLVNASTTINLLAKNDIQSRVAGEKVFLANSFDLSYNDNLFVVFNDTPSTSSLNIPCYRTVSITSSPTPTTSSFSATDVDGGNVSLTNSFGNSFTFANYRLWSHSRGVVDAGNANDAFIVRSATMGPTGDNYRFFLAYPSTPNQAFTYSLNSGNTVGGIDTTVVLPSGAAHTKSFDGTTAFNVTVSGNTTTFTYATVGTAPNFVGDGVVIGDLATITSSSNFSVSNQGTFIVTAVSTSAFSVSNYNPGTVQVTTSVGNATGLTFFPIASTSTATAIVAYINATLPNTITATLGVGSSGAGLVNKRILDFSASTQDYVSLVDGENWVNTCSLTSSPQFTTEKNFTLSSSSYSLVGEQFVLIPHTAAQISSFMGAPAVSGVNNFGNMLVSSNAGKVQINSGNIGTVGAVKINGGSANSVGGSLVGSNIPVGNPQIFDLIRTNFGSTIGLNANSWIRLSSALPLQKNLLLDNTTTMQITGFNTVGITAGSGNFYTQRTYAGDATTKMSVNKQGGFAYFNWSGLGTAPAFTSLKQGDFVNVVATSNFNANNKGIFRIVRANALGFWIENPLVTEEAQFLTANTDLLFYSGDSILPGDSFVVAGGSLGTGLNGTYTVSQVLNVTTFTITGIFSSNTAPIALNNSQFNNISSYDHVLYNFYRPVKTLSIQGASSAVLSDIVLGDNEPQLNGKFSDAYGFTFTTMNKLAFPITNNFGIDGYSYYNGLIGETTKVVYGSASDPIVYPGVKSSNALLDIRPPLPKRIQVSLGVRIKTGVPFNSLINTIRSTAAGVINSAPIGQSISLSDIVKAVSSIDGIFATSIISPVYNSSSDVITVQAAEKPLVISQQDISVTLLGS